MDAVLPTRARGLTRPAIAQGARSVARIVEIAGSACVEKRFNAYRDPPSVKLSRELAFYRAYPDVPIMPTLVSHRAPDTITLRYVEGERLIDLIESKAVDAHDIAELSEHYGTVLGQFFADRSFADQRATSDYIADAVQRIGTALNRHPDWQNAPIIDAVDNLAALVQEDATPMMCKTDWSASNMLVRSNRITCLYDFDTGYPGNHVTFLGDILCSASVRLNWPDVRAALASLGVVVPGARLLATAAHFSRWQVQLARASVADNDLGWPGPARFAADLERLTALGASLPRRV